MGRFVKNHWARLIVLTAAFYQVAAALEGFFWPKVFWDFLTKNLDVTVKPFPYLQIINLVFGLGAIAYEWPLKFIAGTAIHRSIETRLVFLPLYSLAALLMYQSTNPGIYYIVAVVAYFWAHCDGEIICPEPWTLPRRGSARTAQV